MAGQNPAAAEAALLSIFWIWESFICAKYLKKAGQYDTKRCPTCNSPRTCKNHFCLQCKTGGLCPAVFRGDNEHGGHHWLQVRRYSRKDSVLSTSLARFISNEGLKHIHTNKLNEDERHCYLRSKQVAKPSSSSSRTRARAGVEKTCEGCMGRIYGSKHSTETFLVCSLQCLLEVAEKRPSLNLLAMNDGAMNPMPPPPFYSETLSASHHRTTKTPTKSRRKRKTPTKTPVDEAPPLPQATADSPLLETYETPREEPVVEARSLPPATGFLANSSFSEALPFPPATEDFPMFGFLADASFGEALPLPPASISEDFSIMFGTTSFGEALPVAPATEDSPMFERPEAPPAAPQTFVLPSEFQALGFDPKWEEKMWI